MGVFLASGMFLVHQCPDQREFQLQICGIVTEGESGGGIARDEREFGGSFQALPLLSLHTLKCS